MVCQRVTFTHLIFPMEPVSLMRGGHDGSASIAQISVMISMPSSQPFVPPEPIPDDERYMPHLEFGFSDVDVPLPDADALRSSSESDAGAKKKG